MKNQNIKDSNCRVCFCLFHLKIRAGKLKAKMNVRNDCCQFVLYSNSD